MKQITIKWQKSIAVWCILFALVWNNSHTKFNACTRTFTCDDVKLRFNNFVAKHTYMDRDKRIWSLSPMRAAKVQASLRIRAVSPEPPLLAHTSSESRGTFRQKARSLAPLNGWACAVKICHDGMLEDTNSLDGAHIEFWLIKTLMYLNSPLRMHFSRIIYGLLMENYLFLNLLLTVQHFFFKIDFLKLAEKVKPKEYFEQGIRLGKGDNPKSKNSNSGKVVDWMQRFLPNANLSGHLIFTLLSIPDKLVWLLKTDCP